MTSNPSLHSINPISTQELKLKIDLDCLIVDTRFINSIFQFGSIPNALFIGMHGNVEYWSQLLIDDKSAEIYLLTEENINIDELHFRFQRAGFNNVKGFLSGGFATWIQENYPIESYNVIHPTDFVQQIDSVDFQTILDVRTEREFQHQHIDGSQNIPLETLQADIKKLDTKSNYYMLCLGGYRSVIAASILKRNAINLTIDIYGGIKNFPT